MSFVCERIVQPKMALTSGTRLGPYEILAPLGAGGMGEVYRARDTRLERTVAIKVLASQLSSDSDFKQRFEREARAISSLNDPHICTLHDIGSQNGIDFLVMEYVAGETLADRLQRAPLPMEQAVKIGIEIAAALENAHRHGIIHRDLKPGNIMLSKSGAKLLDFGLAKLRTAQSGLRVPDLSTVVQPLTGEESLVGTLPYMAPEQLERKELDARTDIFAFGAVLYEMVTARCAFSGTSAATLIAGIVSSEPTPVSQLRPETPRSLERLITACLAKNPDDRWQSAHDIKLQLEALRDGTPNAQVNSPARKWSERIAWVVAATLALLFALVGLTHLRRNAPPGAPIRSSLLPPEKTFFMPYNFALSPDGTKLAFVATDADGKTTLWVRSLNASSSQSYDGTRDAAFPFWSPDSRWIGFFSRGKLRKLDTSAGAVQLICDAWAGKGGTWNKEGTIVFQPSVGGPLYAVACRRR